MPLVFVYGLFAIVCRLPATNNPLDCLAGTEFVKEWIFGRIKPEEIFQLEVRPINAVGFQTERYSARDSSPGFPG